jgi:hypothetical protein
LLTFPNAAGRAGAFRIVPQNDPAVVALLPITRLPLNLRPLLNGGGPM